jgi:predicted chitinase
MKRNLTLEHFRALFPNCPLKVAKQQLPLLNATLDQYRINTKLDIAAFCATLTQESGEFQYRTELASGRAYEGRKDLGNTQPGDGVSMKGHGRIQITGRSNHTAYTKYIKKSGHVPYIDFSDQKLAHRLAEDPYALDSSGWFWTVLHNLSKFANTGNFLKTQIKVNGRNKKTGKPNHWQERLAYYSRALEILPDDIGGLDEPLTTEPTPTTTEKVLTPTAPAETTPKSSLTDKAKSALTAYQSADEGVKSLVGRLLQKVWLGVSGLVAMAQTNPTKTAIAVLVLVLGFYVIHQYNRRQDSKTIEKIKAGNA